MKNERKKWYCRENSRLFDGQNGQDKRVHLTSGLAERQSSLRCHHLQQLCRRHLELPPFPCPLTLLKAHPRHLPSTHHQRTHCLTFLKPCARNLIKAHSQAATNWIVLARSGSLDCLKKVQARCLMPSFKGTKNPGKLLAARAASHHKWVNKRTRQKLQKTEKVSNLSAHKAKGFRSAPPLMFHQIYMSQACQTSAGF